MPSRTTGAESNLAIVLGINPNGLGIVRSLHGSGVPIMAVDREPAGIWDTNIWMSSHTRLCSKTFYPPTSTDSLLGCLLSIGEKLDKPGVLLPSADAELLCVSRNRNKLSDYFRFRVPDSDTVELLADKARFYTFSTKHGVPAPLTYVAPPPQDIQSIAENIQYPCLIKPHLRDRAWNEKFANRKVLIAEDADALTTQFASAYPGHRNLLVQEIVPGPDSNLYFSHVYMSENLDPLAIWTGRKIRQRPIHFGTSTMTETVWVDEIAEVSVRILRQLKCVGYSSIEFKKDPRDGQFKIMEVTQGRTWYPHYLGFGAGVNIPLVWYRDLVGAQQDEPQRAREGVRWIDECRDPAASYDYWRNGELTFADWIRSYRNVSVFAFASVRDPSPLIYALLRTLIQPFGMIWRKVRRLFPPDRVKQL